VVVHYAGAFTGYGPLIAGPQGITYFTLRPVCESGFIPLAQATCTFRKYSSSYIGRNANMDSDS
jgi:hypothetical protein